MIVTEDKILRQMSKEFTGTNEELKETVELMDEMMQKHNGVGISAIQVGVPIRVFLAGRPSELFINPRIKEFYNETGLGRLFKLPRFTSKS